MSFFNMKSWRGKLRHFPNDFPVHYAALFIDRTINNNYMTLLMALHDTNDWFWYLFRCNKSNTSTHSWHTANFESIKNHTSSLRYLFPDVVLVWNYHIYKEKTIKLLLYHSFYRGLISLRKIEASFMASHLKEIQSHNHRHLAAFSEKNSNCHELCNFYIKHMWLLLLSCRI